MTKEIDAPEQGAVDSFEPDFVGDDYSDDVVEHHEDDHDYGGENLLNQESNESNKHGSSDDKFKKYAIYGGLAFLGLGGLAMISVLMFAPNGQQQPPSGVIHQINQQRAITHNAQQQQSSRSMSSGELSRQGLVSQDTKALEELRKQAGLVQSPKPSVSKAPLAPQSQTSVSASRVSLSSSEQALHKAYVDENHVYESPAQKDDVKVRGATVFALPDKAFASINVSIKAAKSEITEKLVRMNETLIEQDKKIDLLLRDVREAKRLIKARSSALTSLSKTPKKAQRESTSSDAEKPVSSAWYVGGVELGVAVLKNIRNGRLLTVMPGDRLKDIGLIKRIDAKQGVVVGSKQIAIRQP